MWRIFRLIFNEKQAKKIRPENPDWENFGIFGKVFDIWGGNWLGNITLKYEPDRPKQTILTSNSVKSKTNSVKKGLIASNSMVTSNLKESRDMIQKNVYVSNLFCCQ